MKFRPTFLFVAVLGVRALWAAPVDNLALPERAMPGLSPILQQAMQQSPRMLSRALDLEIAENNRIESRSNLLPYVGGSYRQIASRDDRADLAETINVNKVYYDFSITQPVFYWGERRNNYRGSEIAKQIAEGNYREAYRQLAQELRGKYGALIVQKSQLARARRALAYAQQQVKIAEERLAKKVISDLEIYPIRLSAEQGQINLERVEFEFDAAKHAFARLSGLPSISDDQIPDEVPVVGYDASAVDELLAAFLSAKDLPNNEVVNLSRQVEIQNLQYRNQKTRLRPKMSAVLGTSQDEQSFSINNAAKYRITSNYIGVSVSWTIFDSFATQAGIRSALARRRQAESDLAEAKDRIAQQAQAQARFINFAARTMAISDRSLVAAESNLRAKQAEFKRGVASESDVSLAELALYDQRYYAYNARLDYLAKIGEFLGTLSQDPLAAALPVK
ncbi:TolC family protein [Oleiharenicola sp. Vm1]|uniref:TolC family protein n=1 Tax=Oleiharenicola sp. Vm1 TaxID=3398393 RepID=UPI0039F5B6A4